MARTKSGPTPRAHSESPSPDSESALPAEDVAVVKLAAEAVGTFVLVLGGCGSAIFAANFSARGTQLGIGFLGVALAFGLTVLAMAVAVGNISGGHFNPAVTIGLACARRTPARLQSHSSLALRRLVRSGCSSPPRSSEA